MSIGVLIITHEQIGQAILAAAQATFGELPLPTRVIRVDRNSDPTDMIAKIKVTLNHMDCQEGVLILTDLFGSTPSNIAQALHHYPKTRLITGLNLPMLFRIMNYPKLDLNSLANKAVSGGRDGIMDCNQQTVS